MGCGPPCNTMSKRVRANRKSGGVQLDLPPEERKLLHDLCQQMREVLADASDPALARLFPVAYPEDEERQAEWATLVQDKLSDSTIDALAAIEDNVDAETLDPPVAE